jgi:hypothetical protein
MGLTKLNFGEIQNVTETANEIKINTNINFKEQISIPIITPSEDLDGAIWVDPTTASFKSKINLVNYTNSFKTDLNSIVFSSPNTISLGGNTGIVNDLVVSGTNTVLNVRSNSFGTAQWSILEVQGNLTIASGCIVNLIRTPLIVRGNILGSGTIISPDGTNGGAAGVGGPGGTGGSGGLLFTPTPAGTASPSTWPNGAGGSAISMPVEYGVSSGSGGPGGRGTAGGGGGSSSNISMDNGQYFGPSFPGGSSGNGNVGGSGYSYNGPHSTFPMYAYGAGGGGAGGVGQNATYTLGSGLIPNRSGGSASTGISGTNGGSAGTLSTPYTGIGTPSTNSLGSAGTSGGAGGTGKVVGLDYWGNYLYYDGIEYGEGYSAGYSNGLPGSPGGSGGNGGAGGGTGGAHLSIYAAGTISSSIKIRPGKGGLTGGTTSLPRAQTGSAWLFTINNTSPVDIDLTGGSGNPSGTSGMLTRILTSNASGTSDFFTQILFEPNGITPAKTKIYLTS